jgi:hypothetical protein
LLKLELPIGIEVMSSICIKCTKGHEHDPDVCPKNYTGSAKGMEADGVVIRLWSNEKDKCYITHLVTDEDSSVRKILTHSYQELVEHPPSSSAATLPMLGTSSSMLPIKQPALSTSMAVRALSTPSHPNPNGCPSSKAPTPISQRLKEMVHVHTDRLLLPLIDGRRRTTRARNTS